MNEYSELMKRIAAGVYLELFKELGDEAVVDTIVEASKDQKQIILKINLNEDYSDQIIDSLFALNSKHIDDKNVEEIEEEILEPGMEKWEREIGLI